VKRARGFIRLQNQLGYIHARLYKSLTNIYRVMSNSVIQKIRKHGQKVRVNITKI